jgi:hypothetical protein
VEEKTMKSRFNGVVLGCTLALGLAGCADWGELRTETKTVDAAGAQSVEVRLKMGAGELRFAGGARALMDAEFVHRGRYRIPEVDYRVSGSKGILTVRQRRSGFLFGSSRNDWDLRLNSSLPADLDISLGAGESKLDLRDVDVRSLNVDMGVGSVQLDLRGKRGQSFDVSIDGGIGSGHIRLPSDVGVRVRVDGGIGSVSAHGFTKSGHVYTNDALGKSPVTIDIKIDAGIGSINLSLD